MPTRQRATAAEVADKLNDGYRALGRNVVAFSEMVAEMRDLMSQRLRLSVPMPLMTRLRAGDLRGRLRRRALREATAFWHVRLRPRATFSLQGQDYGYFRAAPHETWGSELTVEIPIALGFLGGRRRVLEVGNGLRQYAPVPDDYTVVDKYERDAARDEWNRADAIQGPTQFTQPKPGSTVVGWGVVRGRDLNDLLSRQKAVVSGDGGPATGGHPHGEGSGGRNEGRVR